MFDTDMANNRYESIDGLRAYSAIAIMIMHILKNGNYHLTSFIFNDFISSFGNLVFLFMMISSFSMCCGYYERIIENKLSLEKFYSRRYAKILPFFATLCMVDFIVSPSMSSVYEIFANLTLCFGLLPNANISVIGVGWFLGVVFLFYLLFPFFCYLISNKRRAWFSFAVAFIFNYICKLYFFDNNHVTETFSMRSNVIYCSVFFLAGGLIYLYRDNIKKISEKFRWFILLLCLGAISIYYSFGESIVIYIVMFALFLIYAIGNSGGVLSNTVVKFLSNISMEIYLCHMIIYRGLEKLKLIHIFDSDVLSYFTTSVIALCGTIMFSLITKKGFEYISAHYRAIDLKR